MSSVTTLTPLPYPDPTDQPFVHLDLKALAETTTESLYVSSETAPPHKPGRRWFQPSTGFARVSDGTRWSAAINASEGGSWGLAANQSVASGAFVIIDASTALDAPTAGFTNASGAVTVANAGQYQVDAQVQWSPGPGTRRGIVLTVDCPSINASGVLSSGSAIGTTLAFPTSTTAEAVQQARTPGAVRLSAGAVIRAFAFHDAGGAVNVNKGAATNFLAVSTLAVRRVG